VIYVAQEGDEDCGVAVLAMLTDRTLAQTVEWIGWAGEPLKPHELQHWLWKDGCFLRTIRLRVDLPGWSEGDDWPPEPFPPFADRHYLMVTATKGGHWTAVDGDGRLLDPWDRSRDSLTVYGAIHETVGVMRPHAPAR
jgi:hypothetical protein